MNLPSLGSIIKKPGKPRGYYCNLALLTCFFCIVFLLGCSLIFNNHVISSRFRIRRSLGKPTHCMNECRLSGSEPLPRGIVSRHSNLEMQPIQGSDDSKPRKKGSKSLLAVAAGIKQKEVVDKIAKKFFSNDFTIMLFHYDGIVDDWGDLHWSSRAIHVAAINQTKWWFAKRFLHPYIVTDYSYIFLWDEDLGVEHFNPNRYISIIAKEGLEISQPALDTAKSDVHHQITARGRKGNVHRRTYKTKGGGRCYENSTAPPCTGWVEMMAPVFSRAAWRCVWHMIQNDLIHAWGLDKKLGYCAQGERSKNIGVVDSEYIVHLGIPTLGSLPENKTNEETVDQSSESAPVSPATCTAADRCAVRRRSYVELILFQKRWNRAVEEDDCWIDPYPEPET
ncbi:hypothetical protein LUZ62_049542 [Rhynchospora pubera]|uniref:Uncharacterized protein n=1 Tax=Rhynchospora pubera TaxID=906938 RepID=A0AAV8G4W3_9POAL|nr:hypothetical protein LUZ62_049542 [Rhynchospora pubera]